MFCKKCGTEQKDGQKFCPKCGEPFLDENGKPYLKGLKKEMQDAKDKLSSKADELTKQGKKLVHEKVQPQLNELTRQSKKLVGEKVKQLFEEEKETVNEINMSSEHESKSEFTTSQSISSHPNMKYRRLAKVVMLIIFAAIIFTFVRTGFGFSFWWYIYLIVFAFVALILWGATLHDSDGKPHILNNDDILAIKFVSYVGAAMLVILYLWGPLNSNYSIGSVSDSKSISPETEYPSWLTRNNYVCEVETGGKIILRLDDDGTAHMRLANSSGAQLKLSYNGGTADLRYEGTFTVIGNTVYISFSGMSKDMVLEMDSEEQRLYVVGGGVFKQTLF